MGFCERPGRERAHAIGCSGRRTHTPARRRVHAVTARLSARFICLIMLPVLVALAATATVAECDWAGAGFSLLPPGERLALDHTGLTRVAQAATTQPPNAQAATTERQPN